MANIEGAYGSGGGAPSNPVNPYKPRVVKPGERDRRGETDTGGGSEGNGNDAGFNWGVTPSDNAVNPGEQSSYVPQPEPEEEPVYEPSPEEKEQLRYAKHPIDVTPVEEIVAPETTQEEKPKEEEPVVTAPVVTTNDRTANDAFNSQVSSESRDNETKFYEGAETEEEPASTPKTQTPNIFNPAPGVKVPTPNADANLGNLEAFMELGRSIGLEGQELIDYARSQVMRTTSPFSVGGPNSPAPFVASGVTPSSGVPAQPGSYEAAVRAVDNALMNNQPQTNPQSPVGYETALRGTGVGETMGVQYPNFIPGVPVEDQIEAAARNAERLGKVVSSDEVDTTEPSLLDDAIAAAYNIQESDGWATSKASEAYGESGQLNIDQPGWEIADEQNRENILQGMLDIDESLNVDNDITGADVKEAREIAKEKVPKWGGAALRLAKGVSSPRRLTDNVLKKIVGPIVSDWATSGEADNTAYSDAETSAQAAAIAAGFYPGTPGYDNFIREYLVENPPVDSSNSANQPSQVGPSQTDIANYVATLRSNPFAREVDAVMGNTDFSTRNVLLQNAVQEYNDRVNQEVYDRTATENAFVPTRNDAAPAFNSDGTYNDSLDYIINNGARYTDDNGMTLYRNPDGTFSEAVVDSKGNVTYRPYKGNVNREQTLSPDDILGYFVNWGDGTGAPGGFKGLEGMWNSLSDEEAAGMRELLLNKGFHNGIRGEEFANLTEAEYRRLAQLFYDNMPALQELVKAGLLDTVDENGNPIDPRELIQEFFFKALKPGQGRPRSGSGYGYGYGYGYPYRGWGGGGYGGGGGYYGGGGGSSSGAKQNENRVYNIMKNWSF